MSGRMSGVVAIDDGGSSTCVITNTSKENFYSVKGLKGERNLTTTNGKHDFIVDYKGESYVLGTLGKYDCSLPMKMLTKTKQHLFYDLSVLVAIHQYGYLSNYVVVSVPIKMHNDDEKKGRIERLKRSHTITVNGVTKTFSIADVKVAPETASAFWIEQPKGKTRWLDLGSRTIGAATCINENGSIRFIDTESDTFFGKGLEALDANYNPKGLADFIYGHVTNTWNKDDKVYLLGGGAKDESLVQYLKQYFPNAEVLDDPQMSNALGMYNLGRAAYGMV